MGVNDDAYFLNQRVEIESIASRLAYSGFGRARCLCGRELARDGLRNHPRVQ